MCKVLYIDDIEERLKLIKDDLAFYYKDILNISNKFIKKVSGENHPFVIIHNSYFQLENLSVFFKSNNIDYITFSGNFNDTENSNGELELNDFTVRKNLIYFLDYYINTNKINKEILLYGKYYSANRQYLEFEKEIIKNLNRSILNNTFDFNKDTITGFSEDYSENKIILLSKYSNNIVQLISVADTKLHDSVLSLSEKKIGLFLIPLVLSNNYFDFTGIKLALHIRLTKLIKENKFSPIIFLSCFEFDKLKEFDTNNILNFVQTRGCKLIQYENLQDINEIYTEIVKFKEPYDENDILRELFNNNIAIDPPNMIGRHNIANEWGAFRLAFSAGMKEYQVKPLYIKYKSGLSKSSPVIKEDKIEKWIQFLENRKGFNILLIDDENEKWKKVLKFIFKSDLYNKNIKSISSLEEAVKQSYKDSGYDLVFLDLRLSSKDFNRQLFDDNYELSGQKILKKIKTENPSLPVIIFTASNKIWFLDKQIQLGADGYFIKESLEFGIDDDFSYNNYLKLLETIQNVINKSKYLRNIWKYTEEIKSHFSENNFNDNAHKRIIEKLEAAFGVLKLKRIEFDENHYLFSDFELAFIIYWSILVGEIFALNIEENKNIVKIKYGNIIIIQDSNFRISYDKKTKCFYDKIVLNTLGDKYENIRGDRFKAAAIILLKNMKLQPISITELKDLSQIIKKCNEYRNKLEYIHSNTEDIYKNTVLENRKWNIKERKEKMESVFKLIYYLLTNKIINNKLI